MLDAQSAQDEVKKSHKLRHVIQERASLQVSQKTRGVITKEAFRDCLGSSWKKTVTIHLIAPYVIYYPFTLLPSSSLHVLVVRRRDGQQWGNVKG